ncbi:MAG: IPExxxVDY family protein [Bacteroidota bacterium]
MPGKKNKLKVDVEYGFDLIGVTSSVKEYKLAWILNQCDSCDFIKSSDIQIDFVGLKNITISNFKFQTEHTNVYLLKNRLVFNNALSDQYLIPELKRFDYFVKIDGVSELFPTNAILATLKNSENIQYAITLDPNTIKQKENFIF